MIFFSLSSWPLSLFAYYIPVNTQAEVQNLPELLSSHFFPMRYSQLKLCLLAHLWVWRCLAFNCRERFLKPVFWNEEIGMSSPGGWHKSSSVSGSIPHTLLWGLIVEISQKEVHKANPNPVWSLRWLLGESSLTLLTDLLHRVGIEPELFSLS